MKKIVPESLLESMQLEEGFFSDVADKVKSFFKKIGRYFATIIDGKALEVVHPVNIGLFEMDGLLPEGLHFIPSSKTIKLDPSMAALREKNMNIYKNGGVYDKSVYDRKITKITESFVNKTMGFINEAKEDSKISAFAHDEIEIPDVDNNELMRRVRMCLDQQKVDQNAPPLLIWGAPGIGKTEICYNVLRTLGQLDCQVIVVPIAIMAREDWAIPKEKDERAVSCYVDWLPIYRKVGDPKIDAAADDAANQGGGGILFFDEISRAAPGLIASLLTLVQSRRLGEWHLGSKWTIIGASNRASDDFTAAYAFSSALGNRFDHINFVPSHAAWANWARGGTGVIPGRKIPLGQWKRMLGAYRVDPRILDFTEFNHDFWYTLKKTEEEQVIFASMRTWQNASKNIDYAIQDEEKYGEGISYAEMENIVASSVGKTAAKQFMTFMRLLQQYTTKDIKEILENPDKAPLPTKKGSGYDLAEANAIVFVVCSYTKDKPITPQQWTNYNKYLVRLDNPSLATKGHKLMIGVNEESVESNGPDHINSQLGEVPDPKRPGKFKDKFQEGYDIFKAKYGDVF